MPEGKKTEPVKVWMSDALQLELAKLADADDRKLSSYIQLVLRKHVFGHRASAVGDDERDE